MISNYRRNDMAFLEQVEHLQNLIEQLGDIEKESIETSMELINQSINQKICSS